MTFFYKPPARAKLKLIPENYLFIGLSILCFFFPSQLFRTFLRSFRLLRKRKNHLDLVLFINVFFHASFLFSVLTFSEIFFYFVGPFQARLLDACWEEKWEAKRSNLIPLFLVRFCKRKGYGNTH